MLGRALLLSLDCSTLPSIHTLHCWVLSKDVWSTIFKFFGMTRPRSPGPLVNTMSMSRSYFLKGKKQTISCRIRFRLRRWSSTNTLTLAESLLHDLKETMESICLNMIANKTARMFKTKGVISTLSDKPQSISVPSTSTATAHPPKMMSTYSWQSYGVFLTGYWSNGSLIYSMK